MYVCIHYHHTVKGHLSRNLNTGSIQNNRIVLKGFFKTIHFLNQATVITEEQFAIVHGDSMICWAANDRSVTSWQPNPCDTDRVVQILTDDI
jgi:hypothetical protein